MIDPGVVVRQRIVFRDRLDACHARQQRDQRWLAGEQRRAATLHDRRQISGELHSITEPLLGVDQDPAPARIAAVPDRSGKSDKVVTEAVVLFAPLILGKSAPQIAGQ